MIYFLVFHRSQSTFVANTLPDTTGSIHEYGDYRYMEVDTPLEVHDVFAAAEGCFVEPSEAHARERIYTTLLEQAGGAQ